MNKINSDEAAHDIQGFFGNEIPSRLYYCKALPALRIDNPHSSQIIGDGLRVFWENEQVRLQIIDKGDHWEFHFERLPGGFFSLSWQLETDEIERLRDDTIVAMGVKVLEPIATKPSPSQLYGKLFAVKGRRTRNLEREGCFYDGLHQVRFAMTERNGEFYDFASFDANRMWFDYLITHPRYKRWKIGKPRLWFQLLNRR